jgi:hypothetical protein
MPSLSQLAARASGSLTGPRRVYVPKSKRRPVVVDPWHVIVRRVKAAGVLRKILFGGHPPKVSLRRQETWGWLFREMCALRDFRYSDVLKEGRRFVELHGHVAVED